MIYAYARVSSTDQNLNRQRDAFKQFGIAPDKIFSDKKSGKDFEPQNYRRLLKKLKQNDLLVIKSIDRLGRNYDAIIEEWNRITNKLGCDILVLDMPLLDTRTKADTLVGKFLYPISSCKYYHLSPRTNVIISAPVKPKASVLPKCTA